MCKSVSPRHSSDARRVTHATELNERINRTEELEGRERTASRVVPLAVRREPRNIPRVYRHIPLMGEPVSCSERVRPSAARGEAT